jgi:hypothetical protein
MADRKLPPHVVFIQLNDIYHIDAKSNYADPNSLIFPSACDPPRSCAGVFP